MGSIQAPGWGFVGPRRCPGASGNAGPVAGYVAPSRQTGKNADAYDTGEVAKVSPKLRFDSSWDKKTGYRTTQILGMPILHENRLVVGVVQLLNKKKGGRFTKDDE